MAIDRPWCVVTLLLILFVLHHSPALNPINSEKLRVLDLKIEMRKRRSSVTATLNEDFLVLTRGSCRVCHRVVPVQSSAMVPSSYHIDLTKPTINDILPIDLDQ